jgi:glycosyltransferase involved in cell wall biosynthesis
VLLSLAGSGPILHRRQLAIIFDANVYRHPEFFSKTYGTVHRKLGRALAKTAKVGTISEFSRSELAYFLGLPSTNIRIFACGAEHMRNVAPCQTIVDRLGLAGQTFFVTLGNLTPNKNIALPLESIARLAAAGSSARLVVVGGVDPKVFGSAVRQRSSEAVLFAGRLNDSEVAGLLKQAIGLIFPSRYEGFGIPPLEAMVNDCPVIASDIPAVREVCADSALYVDPDSPDACVAAMRRLLREQAGERAARIAKGRERVRLFSWDRTAALMLDQARDLGWDGRLS